MKWYYTIRGDVTQHGLADEVQLMEMVRAGHLRRTDLVWRQEDGTRWVPAYTVPGLFPPATPPPLATPPAPAAAPVQPLPPQGTRVRFALLKWAALILALAGIALGVWIALRR